MERLTNNITHKLINEGNVNQAIERLEKFENMYDEIANGQDLIAKQLEDLRHADKQKTVQFKELMIKKLNATNFLIAYERFGIK